MRTLQILLASILFACAATHAAAFDITASALPAGYNGDNIKSWFSAVSTATDAPASAKKDAILAFPVDLAAGPNYSQNYGHQLALHYNMSFNQIAEGWSWEPLANPNERDYYRFKFLPLGTETASKHTPETVELYPGNTVQVRNLWRYDYFLAFENLYDFYERQVDDDAGFGATLALSEAEAQQLMADSHIQMLAICRLKAPYFSESNTFWKATFAEPVDYTLRKRYLVGDLLEVWFYDKSSGRVLAKIKPISPTPSSH